MARFAVVGLGRIGLVSLVLLKRLGFESFGISNTLESVQAARRLGLEAYPGDIIANPRVVDRHGGADVVLLALPGSIGFEGLRGLVNAGYNVVDVSFFREDPEELREVARRNDITVIVDAGVAPGLSNLLVARARRVFNARRARVYVGGISRRPLPPLGIVPTWSVEDLIDEYLRPARMIVNGRVVAVNPLDAPVERIDVHGVGTLEYFPTDGLRSLLYTMSDMEELVEYTLRWPGHMDFIRKLGMLGFLSERHINVDGCPVIPKDCLAKTIEHNLPRADDLVVLLVAAEGDDGAVLYQSVVHPRMEWSAMSIATSTFQVATAILVAEGRIGKGLIYPEQLGLNEQNTRFIIKFLEREGVVVAERHCGSLEECL